MNPFILSLLFVFTINIPPNPTGNELSNKDQKQIKKVLTKQQKCWNKGDIDCFMEGYWHSDELRFMGKNGVTYGWQNTFDRYKKTYPDKAAMGQLSFEVISLEALGNQQALMLGKWQLDRSEDVLSGHFSLIWRVINGQWCIVFDHSS